MTVFTQPGRFSVNWAICTCDIRYPTDDLGVHKIAATRASAAVPALQ